MTEREPQPQPFYEISFDELCLMIDDQVGELHGQISFLESLVGKAEYGLNHNFRVKILTDGDNVSVELETKPPIGFRTS